jgi:hypothetical protein
LYFESIETPPGCSPAVPNRYESEFDETHEIVVLRSCGKVLAVYGILDLEAAEARWAEEWEEAGDRNA